MKNRIVTTSFREIKSAFPRFLSLLIMSMLGLFCFVGLQSTGPDMIHTLDTYLDAHNVYDIKVNAPLGVVEEDIIEINELESVEFAKGIYSLDTLINSEDTQYVINISNLTDGINDVELIKGTLPKTSDELVVEQAFLDKTIYDIGDKLSITANGNRQSLTIVGVIRSPLHFNNVEINNNRGHTQIGTGTINFYSYVTEDFFDADYYNSVAIKIADAKKFRIDSKEYNRLILRGKNEVARLVTKRVQMRMEIVSRQLENTLHDTRESLNQAYNTIDNQLQGFGLTRDNLEQGIQELLQQYYETNDPNIFLELLTLRKLQEGINDLKEAELAYNDSFEILNELNELIENPEDISTSIFSWSINDRNDWSTYKEYINDTKSVSNLSIIFPAVFYVVAVLISLISMSRMVEDDRALIGTLKSLGFSNIQIMYKYFVFSLLAVLIGGVLGTILGAIILPNLIFSIYTLLFDLPFFLLKINILATVLGFIISMICICGTTLLTVRKVLKEKPSELLRPKAPKDGKRIVLEKWKFLWNKLSFSKKVTIRNIFRYKKRVFVTIGGVVGCTALILCGFGLRDSIVDIPSKQYDTLHTYDAIVYVNLRSENDTNRIFKDFPEIDSIIATEIVSTKVGDYSVNLVIPDNIEQLNGVVKFNDLNNNSLELVDDKVIISDKLAQLTKLKVGDFITYSNDDNRNFQLEISGICENYVSHYIFMNKTTYTNLNQRYFTNALLLKLNNQVSDYDDFAKRLLEVNEVISVSMVDALIDTVEDMLKSLDKVVLILIILASILSFVVMYNLSNININERKREIATLKVLGFYHHEVDNYITKENILLTLLGIVIGLLLGILLTNFVVTTVEVEGVRFIHHIKFLSYIYSAIITIVFTYIVNIITHFSLKKINMIESLKSVE